MRGQQKQNPYQSPAVSPPGEGKKDEALRRACQAFVGECETSVQDEYSVPEWANRLNYLIGRIGKFAEKQGEDGLRVLRDFLKEDKSDGPIINELSMALPMYSIRK